MQHWPRLTESEERLMEQNSSELTQRAEALHAAGKDAVQRGDYGDAALLFAKSLELTTLLKNPYAASANHMEISRVFYHVGMYDAARTNLEAAIRIQHHLGNPMEWAFAIGELGMLLWNRFNDRFNAFVHW